MVAGILDKVSHQRAGGDDGLLGLWIDGSKGWEGLVFGLDKDMDFVEERVSHQTGETDIDLCGAGGGLCLKVGGDEGELDLGAVDEAIIF